MARVVLGTETQSAGANREVAQGGFGIQGLSLWESSGFIAVRHACNLPVSTSIIFTVNMYFSLLKQNRPRTVCQYFVP